MAKKKAVESKWMAAADRMLLFGSPKRERAHDVNGKLVVKFGGQCYRSDSMTYCPIDARLRRDKAVRALALTLRRLPTRRPRP